MAALEISAGRADLPPEDHSQVCALMAAAGVIRRIMNPGDLGALEAATGKLEGLQVEIATGLTELHWKRRPWWSRR
ncbi:hypothetical protein I6A62_19555 [Frankia sp. AgW1.1]|nr:hypothetical protein [Frankia sp. AgW1.1]